RHRLPSAVEGRDHGGATRACTLRVFTISASATRQGVGARKHFAEHIHCAASRHTHSMRGVLENAHGRNWRRDMSVRDFPPFFFVLYYDIVPNRWIVRTLRRVAHGLGYRPEFERAFHMPDGLGAQDPRPVAIFSAEPILSGNGESNALHNLANIDLSFTDM